MDRRRIPDETRRHTPDTTTQAERALPVLNPAEQRRYPRVKCFLAIQLRPADDQRLLLGKLSDVSLGGCGVEFANDVKVGTAVALSPLAAGGKLWVQGVVVNTRLAEAAAGYCIGVRFNEDKDKDENEGEEEAATHNVKEFVHFVEESAARQARTNTYPGGLERGKSNSC